MVSFAHICVINACGPEEPSEVLYLGPKYEEPQCSTPVPGEITGCRLSSTSLPSLACIIAVRPFYCFAAAALFRRISSKCVEGSSLSGARLAFHIR
jgi:hypothetical protein